MKQKSGIFLVDKPKNITSNDLVQKIKQKFGYKKVGHAGTLDPLATGLMIILVNQATKISNFILSKDKKYRVVIKMFIQTDTFDITGKVMEKMEPVKLVKSDIKNVIDKYNGYIYDQYPPMYSAIKVNGKKLYEYARKNEEIQVKPRAVTINECILLDYNKSDELYLEVDCSKGTYVRSLVNDIMKDLNIIGTVKELQRCKLGNFDVEDAIKLDEIAETDLVSMYDALLINKLPLVVHHQELDIRQGKPINVMVKNADENIFIVDSNQNVIAVYKRVAKDLYTCLRGLWDSDNNTNLTDAEKDGF